MAILTREQILSADDIKIEVVPVPAWGGDVIVRGLTGRERDAYEATVMRIKGTDTQLILSNARAKLVAASIVDESGQRLFDDTDVVALGQKSAESLQRIYDVAARLSGLTKSDLDDLTKNSADGQPDDSLSA
jgi:hypothetical protein